MLLDTVISYAPGLCSESLFNVTQWTVCLQAVPWHVCFARHSGLLDSN